MNQWKLLGFAVVVSVLLITVTGCVEEKEGLEVTSVSGETKLNDLVITVTVTNHDEVTRNGTLFIQSNVSKKSEPISGSITVPPDSSKKWEHEFDLPSPGSSGEGVRGLFSDIRIMLFGPTEEEFTAWVEPRE